MGVAPAAPTPPLPWRFFIVAIVVAIAVSALIAYLGLTGHIGAGITGEKPPGGGAVFLPFLGLSVVLRTRHGTEERR